MTSVRWRRLWVGWSARCYSTARRWKRRSGKSGRSHSPRPDLESQASPDGHVVGLRIVRIEPHVARLDEERGRRGHREFEAEAGVLGETPVGVVARHYGAHPI